MSTRLAIHLEKINKIGSIPHIIGKSKLQMNSELNESLRRKLRKLGIERNLLNLIKDIYKKLIANIIFNGERLNISP